MSLPDDARLILGFERRYGHVHTFEKNQAIRRVFGLPAHTYYDRLNKTLDVPEAVVLDPPLVLRLRRLREQRRDRRQARRIA